MAEYIDREAAEYAVGEAHLKGLNPLWELRDVPAADVAPVVHGKWLHSGCEECSGLEVVKCSECNHEAFAIALYVCNGNYCPSCGARMDGGVDNG